MSAPLDTLLIIHNVGYVVSAILMAIVIVFLFIKDHKTPANRMFLLGFLAVLVFAVAHVIGVNVADPYLSRDVLMWSLSFMFVSLFFVHGVLAYLGLLEKQKKVLITFYVLTLGLVAVYLIFPNTFLLPSVPKLYFPNYYVASLWQWPMILLSGTIIPLYFLTQMVLAYRKANQILKNRLKYFITALFLGYAFGLTIIPLAFGYTKIDPILSIFFIPFFVVPFSYAILRYDLLDIKVIAKRALVYSLAVAGVGLLISVLDLYNDFILKHVPGFPAWIFPFASAAIAVLVGFFVWKKLRETDFYKYEFLTVVTHKFRTPLTYIKWSTENLMEGVPENLREDVQKIQDANYRLVELTNILVHLSDTEDDSYAYKFEPADLCPTFERLVPEYEKKAGGKKISLSYKCDSSAHVSMDESKIDFVIQTLIDNAISYTPTGGTIKIALSIHGKEALMTVADDGIGMTKDELGHIFTKFYRGASGRKADTEGMGIGLFMAKRIVEKHNGRIWAESEGKAMGTTFFVALPLIAHRASR